MTQLDGSPGAFGPPQVDSRAFRATATGRRAAMLSAAIPFALELHALRVVGPRAFGVIISASPAVAATIGWALLAEPLHALQVLAICCVVTMSRLRWARVLLPCSLAYVIALMDRRTT